MNNIISSIRQFYPVSDSALSELTKHFVIHRFPKKHMIIREGIMDRNVYFIEQGICRSFVHYDGKEVTTWFSREGDITFALKALYHNEAGFENVQAIEECVVYSIPIETLNRLYTTEIDIANWSRVVHQECLLSLQCTRIDRLNLSAKERYEKLLEVIPDIYQRVNLSYIASYLGITQSALSRIRKG